MLWLLGRGSRDEPLLVARIVIARRRHLPRPPPYAVGNSRYFAAYEVTADLRTATPLRAIPVSWGMLASLVFKGRAGRLRTTGVRAYAEGLASLRCLLPESAAKIEKVWKTSSRLGRGTRPAAGLFGDSATNRLTEKAAVRLATERLKREGWVVRSVERERCGYDLHCSKDGKELHVEVKGRAGEDRSFLLTSGELTRAEHDPDFQFFIVSNVARKPRISILSGKELAVHYSLQPTAFIAAPNT